MRERRMSSRTAFVSAVLVFSLPGSIQAHDIYSHLTDERGASCCDDRDCRPALYRLTARGVQMYVDHEWINVPKERIQYRALPGDTGETYGGHWCGSMPASQTTRRLLYRPRSQQHAERERFEGSWVGRSMLGGGTLLLADNTHPTVRRGSRG